MKRARLDTDVDSGRDSGPLGHDAIEGEAEWAGRGGGRYSNGS